MHLVAIETTASAGDTYALRKIVPLHPVLVRRHIRILKKVRSPRLQISSSSESDSRSPRKKNRQANRSTSPIGFATGRPGCGTEYKCRCLAIISR